MNYNYVGTRYMRPESIGKVTGTTQYTADLFVKRRDILVAKVKRIDCARAKIIQIDTAQAKALPGVVAVLTADDVPNTELYGYLFADKPILVKDEIICDCDPVAFVAAETAEIAQAALDLIKIEFEPLPAIEDPRVSCQPGAPSIHENHPISGDSNISFDVRVARGDVDAALQNSMVIVENEYRTPIGEHAAMELDVAIAEPDSTNAGGLTIYAPQQDLGAMRKGLSKALGLPISKIRVVTLMIGGGFGGKECSVVDCAAVAGTLALKTGRSVMYEMTREEVFRYTSKGHRGYISYRMGADQNGNILGMRTEGIYDKGAYKSADIIPHRSGCLAGGGYRIPAADVHNYSVFTNHVYGGAMRGLGAPQQHFALECTIDDLALQLGMDPIDFRLKNILKDGDYTIFGQCVRESGGLGLKDCLTKVREQLSWDTPLENSNPDIKRGRGVAAYMYGSGTSMPNDNVHAYIEMNLDGSLNVNIIQCEMGQGMISAITLIASDAMGVTPDKVNIGVSDSLAAPRAGGAYASRTTVLQGNAIISGCNILKERILKAAAALLSVPSEALDIKDNFVFSKDYPDKRLALAEAVIKADLMRMPLSTSAHWYPREVFADPNNKNQTQRWTALSFGAHGVEIEVDTKTGIITILRSVHAIDLGKAINPDTAEGQVDGGSCMAFGWGLMEEGFMKDGHITNASFHEFLIPTAMDTPKLESILVESGCDQGPFGAKGIGEPVILGGAPALRNALLNATGLAMYEIPLTPVRVMAALEDMKNAKKDEKMPFFKVPLEEDRRK